MTIKPLESASTVTCTHEVRLFARARDLAGADSIPVRLPAHATVGELRRQLALACPALENLLERCALAVNAEFATDDQRLPESAEIALLPPVSGG
jgi:molybdopterin synthase catalytic subunit/molybdopterin synthase sulfur carrier subunit